MSNAERIFMRVLKLSILQKSEISLKRRYTSHLPYSLLQQQFQVGVFRSLDTWDRFLLFQIPWHNTWRH